MALALYRGLLTGFSTLPIVQTMIDSSVNGYMRGDPVQTASGIGNDFESWDYAFECAQKLPHHSTVSFTAAITQTGYAENAVSYIFTEKDLIVAPEYQDKYIKNIEEVKGKKIDVVRKSWGHCPNWSRPEELVDVLMDEATK